MSEAKVRGTVHFIDETKTYGKNGFRKRLVVLEQDDDRFTNYIPCDFIQEACDSVDELSVGQDVEITYRLSGRKWQRDPQSEVKFFLNAEAISFQVVGGSSAGQSSTGESAASSAKTKNANDELNDAAYDDGDIPF